jgi:flagellar protein FliO/FliZ
MPGNGAAGASYGDLLVTSLVVLGGVCIAAFVVVRVVGRFLATGRTRGAHLLDVVARLPLEPRRSLYVVEAAGKTLLVGTSEMGLSVLSELDGDAVRARAVPRPSFGDLVRSAWQRRQHARADAASGREPLVTARDAAALVPQSQAPASTATELARPAEPVAGSPVDEDR